MVDWSIPLQCGAARLPPNRPQFTRDSPRYLGESAAVGLWIVASEAPRRPMMRQQLGETGDQADDDAGLERTVVGSHRIVDGAAAPRAQKRADLMGEERDAGEGRQELDAEHLHDQAVDQ